MAENQRLMIEISRSSFCYKMNAFELLTYQDKVCNVLALECDITPHKGALILIISCEKIPSVVIVKIGKGN
jgi:hypothetical protein